MDTYKNEKLNFIETGKCKNQLTSAARSHPFSYNWSIFIHTCLNNEIKNR